MADSVLGIGLSSWILDFDRDPFRLPPRPPALRGTDYEDRFDFTTVYSDAFWDEDGCDVILLSPTLYSLEADLEQKFTALPSGEACAHEVRHGFMQSQTRVPVPAGTQGLAIESTAGHVILAIQPNLGNQFAGHRVITTLSRNNDLQWIADWARFYVQVHGCDCVLLYDNASDRYSRRDIAEALAEIPGLEQIAVIDWPFPYGAFDVRQPVSFAQVDSISCQSMFFEHARRRCLSKAKSVLNADIDELAVCQDGRGLFEITEACPTGFIQFEGLWVENVPSKGRRAHSRRHRDFHHVMKGRGEISEPKWAIAPERTGRDVQWSIHSVLGAVPALEGRAVSLRHFKAINTDWDVDRPADLRERSLPRLGKKDCESDEALETAFARVDWEARAAGPPRKKKDPLRATYLIRRDSRALLEQGETQKAIKSIRGAIRKMPRHPGFHLFLAEALEAAGDSPGAKAARDTAQALRDDDPWFHFQMGRWAQYFGDRDTMKDHWLKAISLEPSSNLAHCEYTKCMIVDGEIGPALAIAEAAVERDPNDTESCVLLAHAQNLAGQGEAAVATLRRATAASPADENVQRWLGQFLLVQRRTDEAESAARTALSLSRFDRILATIGADANRQGLGLAPSKAMLGRLNEAPFHGLLAQVFTAQGDWQAAEEARRKAVAANPDAPDTYLAWARILETLGRQGDADAARQQALGVARENFHRPLTVTHGDDIATNISNRRQLQLIHALVACDDLEEAARVAQEATKTSPDDAEFRFELAMVYHQMGRLEDSIATLLEAIGLRPRTPKYWHNLGTARLQKGDLRGAETALRKAIKLNPQIAGPRHQLSNVLNRQEKLAEAIEAEREAIELAADNAGYQFHLGILLLKQGTLEKAESALRRAIELDAKLPGPQRHLSTVLDRLDRGQEAVEAAQKAFELAPDNAGYQYHLGNLLLKQGSLDEAEAALRRATELDSSLPGPQRQLSTVLDRLDRGQEAIEAAQRAADLDPENPRFQHHLGNLLMKSGSLEEAEAAQRRAIQLDSTLPGPQRQLDVIQERLGRTQEAVETTQREAELDPGN